MSLLNHPFRGPRASGGPTTAACTPSQRRTLLILREKSACRFVLVRKPYSTRQLLPRASRKPCQVTPRMVAVLHCPSPGPLPVRFHHRRTRSQPPPLSIDH